MPRSIVLAVGVLASTFAACAAQDDALDDRPGLEAESSAAAVPLVAQCRAQGEQCAADARKHHCDLTSPTCMTGNQCTAQMLQCISNALQN